VVVAEIPEVNGTFEAAAAFANMMACVVAAGFGVAVVFAGFKTLCNVSERRLIMVVELTH
jgi:hypothetical protein